MSALQLICAGMALLLFLAMPLLIAGCLFFLAKKIAEVIKEPLRARVMISSLALLCWALSIELIAPLGIAADYFISIIFA